MVAAEGAGAGDRQVSNREHETAPNGETRGKRLVVTASGRYGVAERRLAPPRAAAEAGRLRH